jgi:hypothetical protein
MTMRTLRICMVGVAAFALVLPSYADDEPAAVETPKDAAAEAPSVTDAMKKETEQKEGPAIMWGTLAYNAQMKSIFVKKDDGRQYEYMNVPQDLFDQLEVSNEKDDFFAEHIQGRHTWRVIHQKERPSP